MKEQYSTCGNQTICVGDCSETQNGIEWNIIVSCNIAAVGNIILEPTMEKEHKHKFQFSHAEIGSSCGKLPLYEKIYYVICPECGELKKQKAQTIYELRK